MCGGGIVDVSGVFIIIQVDYVVLAREIVVQVTPDMCLRHKRGKVYEPWGGGTRERERAWMRGFGGCCGAGGSEKRGC